LEWQDNFGKELEENGLIYIPTYSCRNLGNNKTTVRITNIPAKIRFGVLPDTRAEYYPVYCPPQPHVMSLCSCSCADEDLGIYKVELIWQY
jgi:hypothetical protein